MTTPVDRLNAVDLRYRHDLRERNPLHNAHLDARMEQRLAGMHAECSGELQLLRREIQQVRAEVYQTRLQLPGFLVSFWIVAVVGAAALALALQ